MTIHISITDPARPETRPIPGFPWFWLKRVRGFDPSRHCAACFIGSTDHRFWSTTRLPLEADTEMGDAPYAYLCGVAGQGSRGYRDNLHIPMKEMPGAVITATTWNGLAIRIDNAVQMPIPPLPDGFHGLSRKFTTCRNYQFGQAMFGATVPRLPLGG